MILRVYFWIDRLAQRVLVKLGKRCLPSPTVPGVETSPFSDKILATMNSIQSIPTWSTRRTGVQMVSGTHGTWGTEGVSALAVR